MKRITLAALFCCMISMALAAEKTTWLTSLPDAQAKAKAEKKVILIDFTGSDWCGWCIKLKKETFDQADFAEYAAKNLVLVELDFPKSKPQTDEVKKANKELQKKYDVSGFPTLVVLDADGKVLGTQVGYVEGGPKAMIKLIDGYKKK